jgi:hypothetical protein
VIGQDAFFMNGGYTFYEGDSDVGWRVGLQAFCYHLSATPNGSLRIDSSIMKWVF